MKKYLCATTGDEYKKGEVYSLDENDRRIRTLKNLGYLEETNENITIKGGKKK